jgi:hypothetical protein
VFQVEEEGGDAGENGECPGGILDQTTLPVEKTTAMMEAEL